MEQAKTVENSCQELEDIEYLAAKIPLYVNIEGKLVERTECYILGDEEFRIGYPILGNHFNVDPKIGGRIRGVTIEGEECILPMLSRKHCKITLEDGVRYAYDLGSRTGTYVNGQRISNARVEGRVKLNIGDVISFIPKKDASGFVLDIKYKIGSIPDIEGDADIGLVYIPPNISIGDLEGALAVYKKFEDFRASSKITAVGVGK